MTALDIQVRDQQTALLDVVLAALAALAALPLRAQRDPDRHDVDQQQLQDATHPLPASEEVCALRVRMRGYQVANTALRLAGLDSKAVNDGAGHVISLRTTCIASSNA